MNGEADAFAFETLQVLQWSVASQTFTEIGAPITRFRELIDRQHPSEIRRPADRQAKNFWISSGEGVPWPPAADQLAQRLVVQQGVKHSLSTFMPAASNWAII